MLLAVGNLYYDTTGAHDDLLLTLATSDGYAEKKTFDEVSVVYLGAIGPSPFGFRFFVCNLVVK